jgi:hypothetical protein
MRHLILLTVISLAVVSIGADDPITRVNSDDVGIRVQIIGELGQPLGTFLRIEGRPPAHPGMLANPLLVEKVDGKQLEKPFLIETQRAEKFVAGRSYSLAGYENGAMNSEPEEALIKAGLAKPGDVQQPYRFATWFVVLTHPGPEKSSKTSGR